MHSSEGLIGLVDLTTYLRMCSVLTNSGVSLMRSLDILDESITFEPLKVANRQIMDDIQGGKSLSAAMSAHPKLFTGFLIAIVRAGEIGGVLDDTLERAADFYQRHLEYRRQRIICLATARALGREQGDQFVTLVRGLEVKLVIQYFMYMLGTMLGSGVPIVQALEVAAEILPEVRAHDEVRDALAEAVLKARDDVRDGAGTIVPPLVAAGFPRGVVAFINIGEGEGTLDRMCLRAGDLLGAEIEGRMQEALELNYF